MISWGIVSTAMAFVTTPFLFDLLRFLLGVAEAAFFASIVLYVTHWYPPDRREQQHLHRVVPLFWRLRQVLSCISENWGPLRSRRIGAQSVAHGYP